MLEIASRFAPRPGRHRGDARPGTRFSRSDDRSRRRGRTDRGAARYPQVAGRSLRQQYSAPPLVLFGDRLAGVSARRGDPGHRFAVVHSGVDCRGAGGKPIDILGLGLYGTDGAITWFTMTFGSIFVAFVAGAVIRRSLDGSEDFRSPRAADSRGGGLPAVRSRSRGFHGLLP